MKKPFIVGITGGSASGKTYFLNSLMGAFSEDEICLISQDHYYRARTEVPVDENGKAIPYSIDKLQDRGKFFVEAGDEIYPGMVIGEHIRPDDLVVNICTEKQLTNMRASGTDDKMRIVPKINFSLEEAMEYIQEDEYVELTPKSIRMRKTILNENERKRVSKSVSA